MKEITGLDLAQPSSQFTVLSQERCDGGGVTHVLFKGEELRFFVPDAVVARVNRLIEEAGIIHLITQIDNIDIAQER